MKLQQADKKRLSQEVLQYVCEHLSHMTILAQILWLMFLREVVENRMAYDMQRKPVILYKNQLEKCRADAIVYGEGLYQAVENACLHSAENRGWFGFRVHRASRHATMADTVQETATRKRLYDKYHNCFCSYTKDGKSTTDKDNIFGTKGKSEYDRYFEFFVINNVIGTEDDALGIAEHYNQHIYQDRLPQIRRLWDGDAPSAYKIAKRDPQWGRIQKELGDGDGGEAVKYGRYITHMYDLFALKPREQWNDHIADITTHYGLRVLQGVVVANGGYIVCATPYDNCTQLYYNGNADKTGSVYIENKSRTYFTEWSGIAPMSHKWRMDNETGSFGSSGGGYFGDRVMAPLTEVLYMDAKAAFRNLPNGNKEEQVRVIYENLCQFHEKMAQDKNLVVLQIEQTELAKIEVFSKAVFAFVADRHINHSDNLYLAVIVDGDEAVMSFTQYFSCFYYQGEQRDMTDAQIAVCSPCCCGDGKWKREYAVSVVLAGKDLSSALNSAEREAYYQPEYTVSQLPMLRHLFYGAREQQTSRPKEPVSIFPFDLFLPAKGFPEGQGPTLIPADVKNSWFTRRMHRVLHTEIRQKEYGCLVEQVHVRLGNKVHLNRFFEAEALFHDAGNVARFAYLIVMDLLHGEAALHQNQKILLLGYERYSATLVLQIEYWLKKSRRNLHIQTAIVYNDENRDTMLRLLTDHRCESCTEPDEFLPIIIMPVGTTLSTIHKIYATVNKQLPGELRLGECRKHYCIVLVNDVLQSSCRDLNEPTGHYWQSVERGAQIVTVCAARRDGEQYAVKYYVPAEAKWYSPNACGLCEFIPDNSLPIIEAKRAGTVPASIMPLYTNQYIKHKDGYIPPENPKRIRQLLGNVWYAHIYDGNNHLQFYIRLQELYRENRKEINESLKQWGQRHTIASDAFHVVISPLQISNSAFVKSVVDNVFNGCVRFFHVDMNESRREEVRARFSHIAEDYKYLRRANPRAKFYVHYADCSVITGTILNRARRMITTLLEQTGIPYGDVKLFKNIFLLVNRCHYDMLNTFVEDPDSQAYIYINLQIPSYNTEQDTCPACRVQEKYALLGKRSSTQSLYTEFERLQQKHEKVYWEDYSAWRRKRILHHNSYMTRLMRWLYVHVPESPEASSLLSFVPEAEDERYKRCDRKQTEDLKRARQIKRQVENYVEAALVPSEEIKSNRQEQQAYLKVANELSLQDMLEKGKRRSAKDSCPFGEERCPYVGEQCSFVERQCPFAEKLCSFVEEYLVSTRDYMRLYTMETAYEKLDALHLNSATTNWKICRTAMLKLLADQLANIWLGKSKKTLSYLGENEQKRFELAYKGEWIISYIKVLSREHLVNYYDYRRAIASIMRQMVNVMEGLRNKDQETKILNSINLEDKKQWMGIYHALKDICDDSSGAIGAQYQYQIYMTLLQRMSDLEILSEINEQNVYHISKLYEHVLDRFFAQESLCRWISLPTEQKITIRYLRAVKAATMATSDNTPSIRLADVPGKLMNKKEKESLYLCGLLDNFANHIYLENTQMLYSGMVLLERTWKMDDRAKLRPAENMKQTIQTLREHVESELKSAYSNLDGEAKETDIIWQNPLSGFCRFWHRSNGQGPVAESESECQQIVKPVVYMLQYFILLNMLSKEQPQDSQDVQLPYIYEELCRVICGITEYPMCYMVYFDDGYPEIFAQSGYQRDLYLRGHILDAHSMEQLLDSCGEKGERAGEILPEDVVLVPDVIMARRKNKEEAVVYDYLILQLNLRGKDSGGLYIVLQKSAPEDVATFKEPQKKDALQAVRNLYFMRQKLQRVLMRDYTVLVNFRYDYTYIRPYRELGNKGPSVIHISDLHIMEDTKPIQQKVCTTLRTTLNGGGADLLVVSGDIVDARKANAGDMEQNYRYAEDLLKYIVLELWADEEGYLPHDWRRRIITCTGNHDYAAMNQYQAAQKNRSLVSAKPMEGNSGTMGKFSYYIDFIVRFLDMPASTIIRDDLNELRHYRELNMKVLVLNCSSAATPRRTNKIGVDFETIQYLTERKLWQQKENSSFRLCVAHYSSEYDLRYNLDDYDTIPGWEWDPNVTDCAPINRLVDCFFKAMIAETENQTVSYAPHHGMSGVGAISSALDPSSVDKVKKAREEFQKQMMRLETSFAVVEEMQQTGEPATKVMDKQEKEVRPYLKCLLGLGPNPIAGVARFQNNDLYCQMDYYYRWLTSEDEPDDCDERMMEIICKVSESALMSTYDQMAFKKVIQKICEEEAVDLYLAGHIHAYDKKEGDSTAPIKQILVADQLYDKYRQNVHGYYIANLKKESRTDKTQREIHKFHG